MAEKYLSCCYNAETPVVIPSLGDDSSPPIYAQTHETLELWLNSGKVYAIDVIASGMPPALDAS